VRVAKKGGDTGKETKKREKTKEKRGFFDVEKNEGKKLREKKGEEGSRDGWGTNKCTWMEMLCTRKPPTQKGGKTVRNRGGWNQDGAQR